MNWLLHILLFGFLAGIPALATHHFVQSDGKMIVGGGVCQGQRSTQLWRLTPSGDLDATFGNAGHLTAISGAGHYGSISDGQRNKFSYTISAKDKIVVAGRFQPQNQNQKLYLKQFLANGQLDTNFGANGVSDLGGNLFFNDLAADSAGSIHLVGTDGFRNSEYVIRVDSMGVWDKTVTEVLNPTNAPTFAPIAINSTRDGKFVVSGIGTFRIDEANRFDKSYGNDGHMLPPQAKSPLLSYYSLKYFFSDVAVNSKGEIIGLSFYNEKNDFSNQNPITTLARMFQDGRPDSSFGEQGDALIIPDRGTLELANAIAIGRDDAVFVSSYISTPSSETLIGIRKFDRDGRVDSKFGKEGKIVRKASNGDNAYSTALEALADGTLLVMGMTSKNNLFDSVIFAAKIRQEDGANDPTFNGGNDKILVCQDGN